MNKLEANLDTYRVIVQTIQTVRTIARKILRKTHGDDWERRAIPQPLHGFLEQRRLREAAIQWRLPDALDVLDYAGFENIGDIILANPELTTAFATVSADPDLLRARFLELESIQARVSYGRPVTDSELEFAVSLAERVRKVSTDDKAGQTHQASTEPSATSESTAPPPRATDKESEGAEKPAAAEAPAAGRPPTTASAPHVSRKAVQEALASGDTNTVLTALYGEVTRLAEALWTEGAPLPATNWEMVRESQWYEKGFSRLDLRPLSDFFDLCDAARRRSAEGASRVEIQELLQQRRFGDVLMSLRELFRKHLIKT